MAAQLHFQPSPVEVDRRLTGTRKKGGCRRGEWGRQDTTCMTGHSVDRQAQVGVTQHHKHTPSCIVRWLRARHGP